LVANKTGAARHIGITRTLRHRLNVPTPSGHCAGQQAGCARTFPRPRGPPGRAAGARTARPAGPRAGP